MLVVLKKNNKNQFCLYKNFFIIILSYGQNKLYWILFADNNELMVEACVMILDSCYRIRFKKRLYKKYLKLLGSKIKGYTSERHNTL